MPRVNIDGVGIVDFPDDITPEEMDATINRDFGGQQKTPSLQIQPQQPQQAQPIPQQAPQMADPMAESMGMFSPEAAGRGAQMFAPEIGMTLGGIGGAMTGIPGGSIVGSGLGYAGGEAIKKGEMPGAKEFAMNFGQGEAMGVGGEALGWLASKVFAPIKQGFEMLRAGQLAQKGLPIPASSINPAEKGLKLAKNARETYPGNRIVKEAHEKLKTGAKEMLGEFEKKFGVNEFSKEAADKAFNDWAATMGGNDAPLVLNKSMAVIDDVLQKPFVTTAGPRDSGRWWTKEAQTFAENPTVQGLRDVWATISGGKGADKTARQKLLDAIKSDLKEQYGDEAVQMLEFARNQNNWFKKVSSLQGIIKRSHTTVDGIDTFMPDRFAREWSQARNKYFLKKFSGEELAQIDEFAEMMGVIGNELGKKVSNKGPESLLAQTGGLGALSYALGVPKAAMALPLIKPALSLRAGQIYKPGSGLYQKMLGEPTATEMIPGLVNIGGKLMLLKGMPNE